MMIVALLIGVGILTGGGVYVARALARKRTLAVSEVAGRMGWRFEEAPAMPTGLSALEPFNRGHRHRVRNRMSAPDGMAQFDLRYTVGGGKHAHRFHQTVAELPVPPGTAAFAVQPEHLGHRIATAFGMQDIDFPEHPVFSQRFLLRAADEGSVRSLFRLPVVQFFEVHPGLGATCSGTMLYVYRSRVVVAPAEMDTFLAMSRELHRRLLAAAGANPILAP